MGSEKITGEKKGSIYYLTLNRAAKRNAIDEEMLTAISKMAQDTVLDGEIRAILLSGEGEVFSSGIDFTVLGSLVERFLGDEGGGGAFVRHDVLTHQKYLNALEDVEVPIICCIHGGAWGLAMELALACDIRLMTADATWGLPETKFNLIPDLGGTSRMSRLIGPARAKEVIMTGKRFSAQQALDWGLVNYVYPDKAAMVAGAEALIADISKRGPIACGAVKKVINQGLSVDLKTQLDMEASYQSLVVRTEDFKEGITAFLEGRPPQWKRK